ncbi:hypothetical protein SAMN02745172_02483 [Pseudoxanthobacter soli DSM 19599]|uniref:Phage regulatory protein CII (CP76) n=1 Tax=Pseudoxanthobacter soli DSM 19599 TaxID=1123029 RepID=A0A1M7ZMF4_9HYPH|nr:hypothetical protein [Pseudoxanthobacter soli]SHO65836.1 hypothetical protein SAMN02745172_02483 [Pseudoxanthobacter soli DSM 19599]
MTRRKLPASAYEGLKTETRRLGKACGGLEAAAMETRVDHSSLGRYQSPAHEEVFAPIDVIADLEAEAGPIVTRALARLTGHVLVALPPPAAGADPDWIAKLAAHAQESSDLLAGIARALAVDGRISADEVRDGGLRAACADAIAAVARIDHALARIEAGAAQ